MKLNEALKFAKAQTKRNTAAKAAQGEVLPKKKSSDKRGSISPEMTKLLAGTSPLLTKGLESLLKDGDLSDVISLDGMLGLAAQFLPPWAGDALAVGNALASGDVAGAVDALLSKYLPPELKAVYDAIKNLPGGWQEFLKWLFENPKEPQGANGFWAARITDVVVCPGGAGIITTGMPSVLIGGMPAARVDDIALCNGIPSDKITLGEQTVHIGAKWASRITDQTAHGGKITTGFPTVHISRSLGQCPGCLSSAASGGANSGSAGAGASAGGAATISGSGMTSPLTDGAFGGLGDVFKDAMASPLGDIAKNQIGGLVKDKVSELASEAFGKSDKPKVSAQPNNFDDDDFGLIKK